MPRYKVHFKIFKKYFMSIVILIQLNIFDIKDNL